MAKIIAVTGATGAQGGGVVNIMKNVPGWKVRAITRNPSGAAAQKLAAEGLDVVQASFDDEASLVKAFEGVHAVFAVTNWWEILFTGHNQAEASQIETEQGMAIARAAAAQSTLEHYIWSTGTDTSTASGGKHPGVSHMDSKALVDEKIRKELPALAAKTTYMYMGYYPQNMFTYDCLKPTEFPPGSGTYVQIVPSTADAEVLMAGDLTHNPGLWVRQILAKGDITYGKYTRVALERWSFQKAIDVWSEVTGKKGVFVPCTVEKYTELFGIVGREIGVQFQFGQMADVWGIEEDKYLDAEKDLGISADEVIGFRGTMEKWKHTVA
ncbi:NMRAL1 protein [Microdochium trichocladiopsis]|uniref:NMRAL1 protein n=1 Tax=Microdochium trichocladiopsis TaxID=1682393 RepID=A0A9P9BS59_9PEZI|nr:NMRAL1 protein [Microdochium trichocladiopsis]KAH7033671.1 NMRAL1 protein [Microdochium trichocladiopsis]